MGKKLVADDLVKIYSTGDKHLGKEGTEHIVHRELAATLVAKGAATEGEAVVSKKKKKGAKESLEM